MYRPYPDFNQEDSLLAALSYAPFFLLNWIIPIYMLAAKRSRYARLHALHSLALIFAEMLMNLVAFLILLGFTGLSFVYTPETTEDTFTYFLGFFLAFLPFLIVPFLFIIYRAYCFFCAWKGNELRIPYITERVLKLDIME